ncbi:unnamed protein product, partial [Arabidopsis halleri]
YLFPENPYLSRANPFNLPRHSSEKLPFLFPIQGSRFIRGRYVSRSILSSIHKRSKKREKNGGGGEDDGDDGGRTTPRRRMYRIPVAFVCLSPPRKKSMVVRKRDPPPLNRWW